MAKPTEAEPEEAAARQLGVEAVSQQLYANVTRYHAAIGADVSTTELASLEAKLLEEGRAACYKQQWEEALNLFTHALAVTEKSKTEMSSDTGNRGTLVHNIAFCLHVMGEFEAAKAYYEQSIECFKKVHVPVYQKVLHGIMYPERLAFELLYGGLNHNRIQMTKERLHDISFGRKPDLMQLDQWGRRKPLPSGVSTTARVVDGEDAPTRGYLSSLWELSGTAPPTYAAASATDPEPEVQQAAAQQQQQAAASASVGAAAGEPSSAAAGEAAGSSRAEQEAARREWLQYYLETSDWAHASELVVTPEEKEDLEYLQERARRDEEHMRRKEQRKQ